MALNAEEIATLLARYLPAAVARERARWVFDDMASVGFQIELAHETSDQRWIDMGAVPQAEYVLPDPAFSINSAEDSHALSGSFLTVGNLLRLSQAVAAGRQYIPHLWPSAFQRRLCGREHLDALTEVWCLRFWRGVTAVEPGPKLNKAAPDYEWVISIQDALASCVVNLEVKRRPGNINAWFKRQSPTARLGDAAKKFGPVPDNTANVIMLTVYFPLSPEVHRGVLSWFEARSDVHGVLIWTEGNLGGEPMLKLLKPSRKWAAQLIRELEPEDTAVAAHCAGTLCSKEDAPAFLKALSEGLRWPKHIR